MKERVGDDNKEERLGLFCKKKRGREKSCKMKQNNTETKIDDQNKKNC